MTRTKYFYLAYRVYRANAHGVMFSIRQAFKDATARVKF